MPLDGRLARDDLETCFSRRSGDEQCMRRAKWLPAGSSILTWMRHRDSAFSGRPTRGPSPDSHFRPPCSRPTCWQTSLPTMLQGGSAATLSINGRVLVDRRAEREAVRSRHPSAARMLICGPGSAVPGDDYRNPVRPGPFGHARQQPAQLVVPLVEPQRRPEKRALPGRRSLRLPWTIHDRRRCCAGL